MKPFYPGILVMLCAICCGAYLVIYITSKQAKATYLKQPVDTVKFNPIIEHSEIKR